MVTISSSVVNSKESFNYEDFISKTNYQDEFRKVFGYSNNDVNITILNDFLEKLTDRRTKYSSFPYNKLS